VTVSARDPWVHKCRGWVLDRGHRHDEALEAYRVALSLDPDDADVRREADRLESALDVRLSASGGRGRRSSKDEAAAGTGGDDLRLKVDLRQETPPPR
jgi:tetratricopeptide (TPR) repeat protein